jgi:hydroxymethylbilane synthase
MSTKHVTVATRGSALAVGQAEPMVRFLESRGYEVAWRKFSTSGDQWLQGPLDKQVGGGFFTKELEYAMAAGAADLLIHSLKDVSLERPKGIVSACIPHREDPADWLVTREDAPEDLVIGTSAVRRERVLSQLFPKARFTWIRGNVQTRLQRVRDGVLRDAHIHATMLAAAGLKRLALDLSGLKVRPLLPSELPSAPGQGALLAEARADRPDLVEALSEIHDPLTARCVTLERKVLAGIGGGCQQPLGALATPQSDGTLLLQAAYAPDGGLRRAEARGTDDAALLAAVLKGIGLS